MASIVSQPAISMSATPLCLTSSYPKGKPAAWLSLSSFKHSSSFDHQSGNSRRRRRGGVGSNNIVCLRGAGYILDQTSAPQKATEAFVTFGRESFPPGFAFGAATAAYQIEGAWNEGGRGPSIWDTFSQQHPEKIDDRSNGNIAVDSYHRYKEDVKLLKDMNADSYRFSISWSRILPKGSLKGGINQEGINYYNNLINELLKNGITPYVTLFHWDVPQALEDEYGGFLSKKIVNDFKDYCEVCFKEFGDRVKYWITLNEPWSFSSMGYGLGRHAPGRCSQILGCSVGDSIVEPYIVTHNLILAHGAAARLYKDTYQKTQQGQIGITLVCMWYHPYDQTHRQVEAANRALDFMLAWYMDPLMHGDYPFSMKAIVRERLPTFSEDEAKMITGTYDFIGINYYTARYARELPFSYDETPFLHINEAYAEQLEEKNGVPIGETNGSWIYIYPQGLRDLLLYIKRRYANPAIYITENGISSVDSADIPKEEAVADEMRKNYLAVHLAEINDAIREGANVKGYFAWSLMDNFEWEKGYTERFGLNYVDYNTFERIPKQSAKWFSKFLKPKPQN